MTTTGLTAIREHPEKKKWTFKRSQRKTLTFYGYIMPWLLGLVLLTLLPLLLGLISSFTNYDGMNLATIKFTGLKNYARAFSDPDFYFSLKRTLLWGAINLPLWMIGSFALALILNQDVNGRGIFRTLYYLPSLVPAVACVQIFRIFLDKHNGLLNALLSLLRPGTAILWTGGPNAMYGMTTIAVWGGIGGGMVIFLAGLQNIPDELVEAARIDGASDWRVFWHIIFPLMTPVIFFQLIQGLLGVFQQLTFPLLMGSIGGLQGWGIPGREIYLYMVHVYVQIFANQRYGYGTALLWIMTVGVVALTLFVFWTQRFWVYTGDMTEEGGR
jgi:multiple sugar transport system permease protein